MMQQIATTPLRIVNAAIPAPRPATILTAVLKDRLCNMNKACRELRMMGYRVVDQDIRMQFHRPLIKIALREQQSVKTLLDRASSRIEKRMYDGIDHHYVVFMGAAVIWEAK